MKEKDEILSEREYFDYLKKNLQTTDDQDLIDFYNGCLNQVDKYKITGQKRVIEKLRFLVDCVSKEREIVKLGINSFVYRDVIEDYIDNVAKNTVKIIDLENYPRDIPDDIVDIIAKTKNIFDKMYVVFTDYTGKVEKQVSKERRDKDPILFGTFQMARGKGRNSGNILNDKFYFLGDWEDEYCDLTMDKFLREVGKEKLQKFGTPINDEEIRAELMRLDDDFRRLNDAEFASLSKPKKSIIQKIVGLFKKNER